MPPGTEGQWLAVQQTPGDSHVAGDGHGVFVIHATLLRTGKVLWFSGHAESVHYLAESWIWDPTQPISTAQRQAFPPGDDIFCCHHAVLDDGRVITVGGAAATAGTGIKAICVLDPAASTPGWTKIGELTHARWYPTLVTLQDGRLAAFSGRREVGAPSDISDTVEVLAPPFSGPGFTTLTIAGGDKLFPTYPSLHMVRGGRVFHTGTTWRYEGAVGNPIGTWSLALTGPTTGVWIDHGVSPNVDLREEGMAVLLPPAQEGKLLLLGGAKANGHPASALVAGSEARAAEILDTQATPPSWRRIADMTHARINASAVLLPDGRVLVLGGHDFYKWSTTSTNSNQAELYDPALDVWTLAATMSESRTYHSAALLLPDGSVIVAGGVDPSQDEPGHPGVALNRKTFEIYHPPYFFNGARPRITAVTSIDTPVTELAYGGFVDVDVDVPAADIRKVVLMRAGSMTHHTDTEQRNVPLPFVVAGASRVRAAVVSDPSVAPPGYYTLWVVDAVNRPCERAQFVRLMRRQCTVLIDRSHYSADEVAASGTTSFPDSFYVLMDGFTPEELGLPAGMTPTTTQIVAAAPSVAFELANGIAVSTMSATPTALLMEESPPPAGRRQRFTFKYALDFTARSVFFESDGTTPIESQAVTLRATAQGFTGRGAVELIHQPNPYMIDGATPWLSIDLRVFKLAQSAAMFGRNVGTTPADALAFITNVLSDFNVAPATARPQFESIPADQDTPTTRLDILESRGGQRIFNFALAQVRYRGRSLSATQVRVFFRAFTTAATGMDFRPETYPTATNTSGEPIPLLGVQGGEIGTIPFFAQARVDSSLERLDQQQDTANVHTLPPQPSGGEGTAYFGCWLDFNQSPLRYPQHPGGNVGPWTTGLQSLRQLIRGRHQCLVAEVHFPGGPDISPGAAPGGHDKLSQRNLAIDESDNPGAAASHVVQHTFEVRPSPTRLGAVRATELRILPDGPAEADVARLRATLPPGEIDDELMFLWGNLPRQSRATLYLPGCDVDRILQTAARRIGPHRLEKIDSDTIACHIGDVTFLPLPSGRTASIPGLLTIQLPDGIREKQQFRVVVRQFDGWTRRIIGTFELRVVVRHAADIVRGQQETLAVMKHIALSISATDRWFPIFARYLAQLSEKVRALGADPDAVRPSPDDTGVPPLEDRDDARCRAISWVTTAVLGLAVAILAGAHGGPASLIVALGLAVCLVQWLRRCRPTVCSVLALLLHGGVFGTGLLALLIGLGLTPPVPFASLATVLVAIAVVAVLRIARRCTPC